MNRCPITYEQLDLEEQKVGYSKKGLSLFSPTLKSLNPIKYTSEQLRMEGMTRSLKMSIQGVQPKVSAKISATRKEIELVTTGGRYILKPQNPLYHSLPENEDLTMKMAAQIDINTPVHGLMRTISDELCYIIKRFDRISQKSKLQVEDFAQLQNKSRDTKYDSSIEQVVHTINSFCSFPIVEKRKLFRRVIFCYLTGNEDMHLKNFSLITRGDKVELSPAYDLLNTTIVMGGDTEEMALPIKGKKKGLTKQLLLKYFGKKRLILPEVVLEDEMKKIFEVKTSWLELIKISFLSDQLKEAYLQLLSSRLDTFS